MFNRPVDYTNHAAMMLLLNSTTSSVGSVEEDKSGDEYVSVPFPMIVIFAILVCAACIWAWIDGPDIIKYVMEVTGLEKL